MLRVRNFFRYFIVVKVFIVVICQINVAQEVFQNRKGQALNGYDTVAYFTSGGPAKGKPHFSYSYNGANWNFVSTQNYELFKANPEQYLPKYGGYCAYAVSQGYTARIKPDAWRIVDGKLYLNYNKGIQRKWEKMSSEYITRADSNWPEIRLRKIRK